MPSKRNKAALVSLFTVTYTADRTFHWHFFLIPYCIYIVRKEGRALGEVTKYLVYNARKRQAGGDTASNYFLRTECIAGVKDMRFQALMPDVLHWLGIQKIDRMMVSHGACLDQHWLTCLHTSIVHVKYGMYTGIHVYSVSKMISSFHS